jgi:hypothetical protein
LSGGAYVIFGTTEDVSNLDLNLVAAGTGGFKIVGMSPYDRAGNEVSSAGDINGDGFDDIIVATYDDDSDVAYVIFGTNQPHAIVDLTAVSAGIGGFKISSANIGDNSGVSVSRAGDLNNDGFDDLLIGASKDSDGGHHSGAAYVLFGFDTDSYERPPGSEGIFGPVIPDPGSGSGGTGGIIVIIGSSGSTMSFGSTDFSVQLPLAAAQSPEMESAAETQNDPGEGYNLFANTADGVTLGTDTAAVMG